MTEKFIDFWKPRLAIFVDSEVWPNMYKNLKRRKIPIILLNARLSKNSFIRWNFLKNFAKKVFSNITLALPQNLETKNYLKALGVKNIKVAGNLKYYGDKNIDYKRKFILKKKIQRI